MGEAPSGLGSEALPDHPLSRCEGVGVVGGDDVNVGGNHCECLFLR